jgi:hypothetical protein
MPSTDQIAAAVAAHGLLDDDRRLPRTPLGDDEWSALTETCLRERLVCLLADAVEAGAIPADAEQRAALNTLRVQLLGLQLRLEGQLLAVIAVLDRHSLDYRILKGPALAKTVYPSAGLRHFHDIDLLVRPDQLETVVRVVTAEGGYRRRAPELRPGFDRRYAKSVTMVDEAGSELDLHRVLVRGVCGFDLDLDELWSSRREVPLAGVTVHVLSPEHQLLHATLGAALSDVPARLSTLRDVAQLASVDRVGADRVAELSAHHRVVAPVARGLVLTERGLGVSLGELGRWADSVVVDARGRRQLSEYRAGGRFRRQAVDIVRVLPWRDRIRYAWALAVPSREFLTDQGISRTAWLSGARARASE